MEKRKRQKLPLAELAELFDLPGDVVAGLCHVEMLGDRRLFVSRHSGILSYSDRQIDVNTPGGVLRVTGENLSLEAMTAEELRIGGCVDEVKWVNKNA
jgi:sporulation protein YqfC